MLTRTRRHGRPLQELRSPGAARLQPRRSSDRIGSLESIEHVARRVRASRFVGCPAARAWLKLPSMSDTAELAALREQIEQQEQRIVELEVEAAYRRKAADELDEVVREQGQRLLLLERRVTELLGQVGAATHEGEVD